MGKLFLLFTATGLFILFTQQNVYAGEGKVHGVIYTDYYSVMSHHTEMYEGDDGFQLRRIYFGYDKGISDKLSSRVRFEMANQDFSNTVGEKVYPFVKDAYLKYKFADKHTMVWGLQGTPTFNPEEKHWGYRSVEKSPLDLHKKFGSSRDFGVAFKGKINDSLSYHIMGGNGDSNKDEDDRYKKGFFSLTYKMSSLMFNLHYDSAGAADGKNITVTKAFLGWTGPNTRVGLLYGNSTTAAGDAGGDATVYTVTSIHVVQRINDTSAAFIRYDMLDKPTSDQTYFKWSTDAPYNVMILGYDYQLDKNVSFIPNIEMVSYGTPEDTSIDTPKGDQIGRITVAIKF